MRSVLRPTILTGMIFFQIFGFIIATLNLVIISVSIAQFAKAHFGSFITISFVIHQHLHTLEQNRRRLQDLRHQLIAYQQAIFDTNFHILAASMVRMENMFDKMHSSLLDMEQYADDKIRKFMNATKWADKCRTIELELNDAENRLFFISMWLDNNTIVTFEEYAQVPNDIWTCSVFAPKRNTNKFLFLFAKSAVLVGAILVTTGAILVHLN